jgi:hypothetical protein
MPHLSGVCSLGRQAILADLLCMRRQAGNHQYLIATETTAAVQVSYRQIDPNLANLTAHCMKIVVMEC